MRCSAVSPVYLHLALRGISCVYCLSPAVVSGSLFLAVQMSALILCLFWVMRDLCGVRHRQVSSEGSDCRRAQEWGSSVSKICTWLLVRCWIPEAPRSPGVQCGAVPVTGLLAPLCMRGLVKFALSPGLRPKEWTSLQEDAWVGRVISRRGSEGAGPPLIGGCVFMHREKNGACLLFLFPEKSTNILRNRTKQIFLQLASGFVQTFVSTLTFHAVLSL